MVIKFIHQWLFGSYPKYIDIELSGIKENVSFRLNGIPEFRIAEFQNVY